MCLAKNVRIICMHDSMGHGTGKYQECEGSYVAAKLLREASGRAFKEDAVDRPGEATDRGFLVSHRLASSVPDDPAGGAAIRAINTQLARILRQGRESHEQHELISLAHKELVQKHHQLSEEYQTLRPYKKMYEAAIWLLDRASAQNAGEQSDRTEAREPLPWSDDARLRNLLRKGRAHVIGADRPISAPTAASPAKGSATVLHLALGTDWESSLMRMRGLEEATGAAVRHCCAVAAGARTESLPDRVQWLRGPNAQRLYRVIRDSGASCVHLHLDGAWDQSWNEIIRAVTDAIGAPFVVTAGGQAPLSDFIRRRAQVVFREAPPIEASEVEALPPLPVLRAAQAGRPAKARRFFARLRFDGSEADAELLQAVKESLDRQRNETSVIVYGDGPALGMAARDLAKYRSQVSFVGQLDPETLAAVAADSAVLVAEPAWLPALAVSLGGAVPLVTTRPGILETLGGERAGFPPFSVPLAQRIEWAVAHPGEERQFLTQCRKLAEARMKVSTSQYSTLYQERAKSE
jgi:glycosyltransferase involved in cell wall biosynthesis